MKASQAEILLRVAENTYANGDEIMVESNRIRQLLAKHADQILEDEAFLAKAWEINQQDKARFAQYMPRQERTQERLQQTAQRAALAPVKKVESNG